MRFSKQFLEKLRMPFTNTPEIRWDKNVGQSLIKSVDVIINADQHPKWYCSQCDYFKSDIKPHQEMVCDKETKVFMRDYYLKEWRHHFGPNVDVPEDDEYDIDGLLSEFDEIHGTDRFYRSKYCQSSDFYKEKKEGIVVDSYDNYNLDFWNNFTVSDNKKTGYNMLCGL